ncbi:MAG TPA: DUF6770 family protein [Flavisolibacter sp.]|jgi:hypothetical protein
MKKQLASLFFALIIACASGNAQGKLTIDQVYKVSLRSSGPVVEKEQIKGYYFLYQSDKIDKKTNEYTLQLVDENLNKLTDFKFEDSRDIVLLESTYNGSNIAFLFYNDKENTLDYRFYNLDGKKSFTYSKVLDKKSEAYFKLALQQSTAEEAENQNLFDIPGKGFISVTPLRENKKYTYDVNFYSSEKRRTWTYNPLEDGKFTNAAYLGANDSVALIEVMSKEKLMSKDIESTILGISLATGRKVFEARTQDGAQQLLPMSITPLRGSSDFLVVGLYYAGGDRLMRDNSEGLGIWQMNNKGKIVKSKYMSWEKDMSKFLKVDQKGRVSELGYVYIHRLMQTEDGKMFAIGEGYKKVADGVGIAMNVLSGSYSAGMSKLKINDMLLLELSPNFELTNAKIYEKRKNNFSLSTGSDFATPHTLAVVAKAYGAFDYTYTQMGQNSASFVSAYTDYEKSKGYKGMTFNSISYYEGKITTDKINLKTDATRMQVLPAKPGSILLMEYFKKEKRLELRMEKLN